MLSSQVGGLAEGEVGAIDDREVNKHQHPSHHRVI